MKTSILGSLFIVATPLGNLQDITLRAIDILKSVDWIAAEDTRHSRYLLQHFSITTATISLHEFNERERTNKILQFLHDGKSIALISDAGTPLISDPGFYLVREARKQGIAVIPIPGSCAAIAALSVAGLPTDRFVFEGFLPVKKTLRKAYLEALHSEARTMIFYEAPHRILETLLSLSICFGGERRVVMARELTKLHETIFTGSLHELMQWTENNPDAQRGEIVLVFAGCQAREKTHKNIVTEHVLHVLLPELSLSEAVRLAAKITGERRNVLYELALTMKGG